MITITPGHKVQGTNPVTGRGKLARGKGAVIRIENKGFHGLVTVVRWTNGVESYHCADLDSSSVQGLPAAPEIARLIGSRVSFHVEGTADAPWPIHTGRVTAISGQQDLVVEDDNGTTATLRPYMVRVCR